MPIANTIAYAGLDELHLDPNNPRLGKANSGPDVGPDRVLELMRGWSLEELALSFLESGYWPQEALIIVKEPLYGPPEKLVAVEGNRRLAALKYLRLALDGHPVSRAWRDLVEGAQPPPELFTHIPYLLADQRSDIVSFLGFRHVTGIKEWDPAQKAEYIAHMVDDLQMSYDDIRRRIGSRLETVRRNYISFRIFKQIEDNATNIPVEQLEKRFSVLFLSLREAGVQQYLNVDIRAEPGAAQTPISEDKLDGLRNFATWLFGSEERKPLFTDSRYVSDFGKILASADAVEYLESTQDPSFDLALQKAGVEEREILEHVREATDHVELALSRAHLYVESEELSKAVKRFGLGAVQLITRFPAIRTELLEEHAPENA